jgi:aspartyl protease family protein
MSDGQAPYILFVLLCLVLVVSALASRRLPAGRTAKLAMAWVALFALGFAIFYFVLQP